MKLLLTRTQRFVLLICATVLGLVITTAIAAFLSYKWGMNPKVIRIEAVLQDLCLFVLPALIVAVLVSRNAADFLCLKRPSLVMILMPIAILLMSLPFMNWLVDWNQSIHLPEHLSSLEQTLRQAEENSANTVNTMISMSTVPQLILAILLVGVMAGFSEELYFRGCLQRLLQLSDVRVHVAIWVTAFVFSAVHMQFFGFVPRLLLGAFFGYMLFWTGSIWVPIIAHMFNNSLYIVTVYIYGGDMSDATINNIGTSVNEDWPLIVGSIVLTALGLYVMRRFALKTNQVNEKELEAAKSQVSDPITPTQTSTATTTNKEATAAPEPQSNKDSVEG